MLLVWLLIFSLDLEFVLRFLILLCGLFFLIYFDLFVCLLYSLYVCYLGGILLLVSGMLLCFVSCYKYIAMEFGLYWFCFVGGFAMYYVCCCVLGCFTC